MTLTTQSIQNISLDLVGLIALADLTSVLERTALVGTSWYLDAFFLAPGFLRQQSASNVNEGELPVAAAMTTGYVFRIENQAMVFWMQRVGRPGHLVDAWVGPMDTISPVSTIPQRVRRSLLKLLRLPSVLYATGIALTGTCFAILGSIHDYWGLGVLTMLVSSRAVNVIVLRRRAVVGWKGIKEPGVQGDLLVLLSQDRWIRLRGAVDDIKLVTSGQWVRNLEPLEGFAVASATLLVYGAAVLTPNASTVGCLCIGALLIFSAALLGMCNAVTADLRMFNRSVYQQKPPKAYARRVHMAEEMIGEHGGRREWAVGMGLVLPKSGEGNAEIIL
ncbi:hypothetical protein PENSPDRAFT_646760 [Peniophora sp. CONT]|nr:hypothetical protein PENSPDRAFT_646760 [Peniophora sp. CONT]